MMAEAKAAGLQFKDMPDDEPDALLSTDLAKDEDGRLYISKSGSAATIGIARERFPISITRCR